MAEQKISKPYSKRPSKSTYSSLGSSMEREVQRHKGTHSGHRSCPSSGLKCKPPGFNANIHFSKDITDGAISPVLK